MIDAILKSSHLFLRVLLKVHSFVFGRKRQKSFVFVSFSAVNVKTRFRSVFSVCVCACIAKADVESRLNSAQTALMLQEDAIHRSEREHRQMMDRMTSLERTLNVLESDKQQLQVT